MPLSLKSLLGGNRIKSIQRGSFQSATGSAAKNIAISPVNFSKSLIISAFRSSSGANGSIGSGFATLDESGTSVLVHIGANSTSVNTTVHFQVVEFE